MCGIVGSLGVELSEEKQQLITNTLKHRGPDDAGLWYDNNNRVFLGHRRLSIIDLSSGGHQPKQYKQDNIWLSYNGEIYNYRELQDELKQNGHTFETDSDTEVLLTSYKEWGIECVKKFKGMFAFLLWDADTETFYAVRDRFGVKPLYYYETNGKFLFASELKALYEFKEFKKELNHDALGLYFRFGYIPAPHAIFRNAYKLEPATILTIKNGSISKQKFWQVDNVESANESLSEKEWLVKLGETLIKSFQYRMVADVEVGVFLSGGIDSSLVAACLQKNSAKKLKTFTIGFHEKGYNEARHAKQVAEVLGTDHYELHLSATDVRDSLGEFVDTFDEPFGDSSALAANILSRFTHQYVKVVLSGDGGDELFYGYTKYEAVCKVLSMNSLTKRALSLILNIFGAKRMSTVARLFTFGKYSNIREKLSKLTYTLEGSGLEDVFERASSYWRRDELKELLLQGECGTQQLFAYEDSDPKLQMQRWDIKQYLPDDILVKSDRTSMFQGLEAREPYLDEDLWKIVQQMPASIRYKKAGSKYPLRHILKQYLPGSMIDKPKTGFRPPIYEWLRGEWRPLLETYFSDEFVKEQGIFNPEYVASVKKRFTSGAYVNPDKLWLLLAFQMWYERWMKRDI